MTAPRPESPVFSSAEFRATPRDEIEPGVDYAIKETAYRHDKIGVAPRVTPRRVTVDALYDLQATVTARENIAVVPHGSTRPDGTPVRFGVKAGEEINIPVHVVGPRWDTEFGKRVDAAREHHRRRMEALDRAHKALGTGGELGTVDVDLAAVLALLDERDRLARALSRVFGEPAEAFCRALGGST